MGRRKIRLKAGEVEAAASRGLPEYKIAEALGVSRDTLQRCKDEQPGIAEALAAGRRAVIGDVEAVAYNAALKAGLDYRYQASMIFWLKANAGWSDRTTIEVVEDEDASAQRSELEARIDELSKAVTRRKGRRSSGGGS